MSQLVAALILRTPRGRNCTRIAVLKDTADKQLNIIGRNGVVIGRGVIIPKVLAFFGVAVARFLRHAGFNAVTDIAVIRTHCSDGGIARSLCEPSVHKIKAAVPPFAAVVGVPVTGKGNKAYLVGFLCGIGSRSEPDKGSNANQSRQKQRHHSFKFLRFHSVKSSSK